jgi:hypothetical protein
MPVIATFGCLYKYTQPSTITWSQAMAKTFAIHFRVPITETTIPAYLVTTATFLAGFFSFAVILSVVGESVQRQFAFVREGRFPVRSSDHLVLLGWNDVVLPMLQQLAHPPGATSGGWQGSVAVLADRPKTEMDELLKQELFAKGYRCVALFVYAAYK